jgi:hypothetical protein
LFVLQAFVLSHFHCSRSKLSIPPVAAIGSFSPGEEDESRDIVDYELTGVKVCVKYPKGFNMKARPSI